MDIQESTNQWGYFCGSFGGMGCIILRKLLEENAIEAPFFGRTLSNLLVMDQIHYPNSRWDGNLGTPNLLYSALSCSGNRLEPPVLG